MPTQISSTPTVKGEEAKKIYKQANQKRSKASKEGAKKLIKKFKNKNK